MSLIQTHNFERQSYLAPEKQEWSSRNAIPSPMDVSPKPLWRFSQHHLGRRGPERYGGGGAVWKRRGGVCEREAPRRGGLFLKTLRMFLESESEMSADHLFVFEQNLVSHQYVGKCDQGNKPKHVICQILINSENSRLLRRSGKRKAQYSSKSTMPTMPSIHRERHSCPTEQRERLTLVEKVF